MNSTDMNLSQLSALIGDEGSITPDVLSLFTRVVSLKEKQAKKAEKELRLAEKQAEKEAKREEAEKKRLKPVKEMKRRLKELKKVERVLDFTQRVKNEQVAERVKEFAWNGIDPCTPNKPELNTTVFKENCAKLMKFILRETGYDNFGLITTNNKRGSKRFLLKSEHGILSGKQAHKYIQYLLNTKCVRPIYDVIGSTFASMRNDSSIDDVLVTLSLSQLLAPSCIGYMVDYIINESHDDEFSKAYQKANQQPEIVEMMAKLPNVVKEAMSLTDGDSSSESEPEPEESESDSDSDSDSD